jgi:hypothetical protein
MNKYTLNMINYSKLHHTLALLMIEQMMEMTAR